MDRLKHWVRLKSAPGLGFQASLKLLSTFGDPANWTTADLDKAFQQRFIIRTAYDHMLNERKPDGWGLFCTLMEDHDIKYTTFLDPEYPELLKNIYSPPLVLYYKGVLAKAMGEWNLGVVGTRKPSEYGRAMTKNLVGEIARAGVTIISGLAYGIDTAAHSAALESQGKTVAVLAQGLEEVYPPQNRKMAESILEKGALVSEYEPGTKMERWNFPARNRIISGLSQGVLIAEGAITSGAMLTAKFALEQSRDVYALPGQINLQNAQGPNHLLKNGARLVTCAQDILQDFGIEQFQSQQADLFPVLTANEQLIYDIFTTEQRDISFDELVLKTGFSIGQLSIALLNLELKNLLSKGQNGTFILK